MLSSFFNYTIQKIYMPNLMLISYSYKKLKIQITSSKAENYKQIFKILQEG